jgi:solute carrier family 25 aspartate/glutamate transporter 12/13
MGRTRFSRAAEGLKGWVRRSENQKAHGKQTLIFTKMERLNKLFDDYATTENGEAFMTKDNFVNAIAPSVDFYNINKDKYGLLFQVADKGQTGKISKSDFLAFQALLAKPDAEYEILFRLVDSKYAGVLTVNQFKAFWSSRTKNKFGIDTVNLYLGTENNKPVAYEEFAQLLKGLQNERVVIEFKARDKDKTGHISQQSFQEMVLEIAGHRLSPATIDRLKTLYPDGSVSFACVMALMNILKNLDSVEHAISLASSESKNGLITRQSLFRASAKSTTFDGFTPLEIDTIFKLVTAPNSPLNAEIPSSAFQHLFHPNFGVKSDEQGPAETKQLSSGAELLKGLYNFALGSVAGAVGATFVYPIGIIFCSYDRFG